MLKYSIFRHEFGATHEREQHFAPEVGESLGEIGQAFPPPAGAANVAPDSDGYVWINPKKFHESFCQDLTAEEALVMAATQKAPVGSVFGEKVTATSWKSKPSWYQISSDDRMIAPANEKPDYPDVSAAVSNFQMFQCVMAVSSHAPAKRSSSVKSGSWTRRSGDIGVIRTKKGCRVGLEQRRSSRWLQVTLRLHPSPTRFVH